MVIDADIKRAIGVARQNGEYAVVAIVAVAILLEQGVAGIGGSNIEARPAGGNSISTSIV
jgi:hypothetical protein